MLMAASDQIIVPWYEKYYIVAFVQHWWLQHRLDMSCEGGFLT